MILFFSVISKVAEERGCLDDLLKLIGLINKENQTLNGGGTIGSDSSCHNIAVNGNGMLICKCTNNLCNSSSKTSHLTESILIFVIYFFLRIFLS